MHLCPDCPETDRWQVLVGEGVAPDERARYERHLESCTACQHHLDLAEQEQGSELLSWARRVGDPTDAPADSTLIQVQQRLHEVRSLVRPDTAEPPDLYYLRPSDRPDVLGMLGDYEIEQVIGQGGMGVVFKAFEPALHRLVAIKVLSPALAGSATARVRFTREAKAAAAVGHDHIVVVHGVHETEGLPYIVMEYIAGESLQERLDRTGPLELTEIVRIGRQTASGLAAAHAQGLIHRDIKPANLLLENGLARVTITDFGLARTIDDVGLTQHGVVTGTPEYMAPEQARGDAIDRRADLFSLGSVLYAMCTGRPPFVGSTALAVLRHVSDQTPTAIRSLNPDVPAWLEEFIRRLMAKDPDDRFTNAAEVAGLLEGYLAHLRQPATVAAPDLPGAASAGGSRSATRWARASRVLQLGRRAALPAAVVLLMGLFLRVLMQPGATVPKEQEQPPPLLYQDFRGGAPLAEQFQVIGADGQATITPEVEGLRIVLPASRTRVDPVGVLLRLNVAGDFEITTGYQILHADQPTDGHGIGFELYLTTETRRKSGLGLSWLSRINEGEVYVGTQMTTDDDGKKSHATKFADALSRSGQLRIVRSGEEAICFAAEGDAPFRKLFSHQIGPENLQTIKLTAFPGWKPNAVDVRIKDLRAAAWRRPKFAPSSTKRRRRRAAGWSPWHLPRWCSWCSRSP